MQNLTELEGAVLGMIGVEGPCTPYRTRQYFLSSPSPYWSGSAGAIYPLIERLKARKLLVAHRVLTGRRAGQEYGISKKGLAELRRWILDGGTSDLATGVPMDPLRTRISFLSSLSPAQQQRFLTDIETRLRTFEALARRDSAEKKGKNVYSFLTARGAVLMSRARTQWIREVRRVLRGR